MSWGWREDAPFPERHGWAGTRDPSAFLTVPKAIEVHATSTPSVSARLPTRRSGGSVSSFAAAARRAGAVHARVRDSGGEDPGELWSRLYEEHRVEVPVYEWEGTNLLRVSIGPYNDEDDVDRLVGALEACSSRSPSAP